MTSDRGPQRGVYLAPFDELADPRTLVALAEQAEEYGWDGFFLWDHILYRPPVRAVADPWVALGAVASHTQQLRIGPLVAPYPVAACTRSPARRSRSIT